MKTTINIELGALCPKVSEQLKGTKIKKGRLRILDKSADSIVWCFVHGLLTQTEYDKARKRLIIRIQQELL